MCLSKNWSAPRKNCTQKSTLQFLGEIQTYKASDTNNDNFVYYERLNILTLHPQALLVPINITISKFFTKPKQALAGITKRGCVSDAETAINKMYVHGSAGVKLNISHFQCEIF